MLNHIKYIIAATVLAVAVSGLNGCWSTQPVMPATTCNLCEFTQP